MLNDEEVQWARIGIRKLLGIDIVQRSVAANTEVCFCCPRLVEQRILSHYINRSFTPASGNTDLKSETAFL